MRLKRLPSPTMNGAVCADDIEISATVSVFNFLSFHRIISQSCVTPTLLPDLKFFDLVFGRTLGTTLNYFYLPLYSPRDVWPAQEKERSARWSIRDKSSRSDLVFIMKYGRIFIKILRHCHRVRVKVSGLSTQSRFVMRAKSPRWAIWTVAWEKWPLSSCLVTLT